MDTKPKLTAASIYCSTNRLNISPTCNQIKTTTKKYTQFNQVEMSPFPFQPINTTVLPFGLF